MFNVVSSGQWPAGYLINPNVEFLDQKWLEQFSQTPAADTPMLGSALTVRVGPGDNLIVLKAIQMARPQCIDLLRWNAREPWLSDDRRR